MANLAYQDVFRFTSLRAPKTPKQEQWYRGYAKDNFFGFFEKIIFEDRNLTDKNVSPIGGKIFEDVFCKREKNQETIIDEVLEFDGFGRKVKVECIITENNDGTTYTTLQALSKDGEYSFSEQVAQDIFTWFLSHRIDFTERLDLAARIIQSHLVEFDKQLLTSQLQQALQVNNLSEFVLSVELKGDQIAPGTGNTEEFKNIKGQLFDLLYSLYMSKRRFPVNLDHIIRQIQTLHVIEFLGYDDFLNDFAAENPPSLCRRILRWLYSLFQIGKESNQTTMQKPTIRRQLPIDPSLIGQKARGDISAFTAIGPFALEPYISSKEDLYAFFNVQPIIHPIFSRLKYFHIPFNDIRPIGIADLKIVKQILVRYEPGEVAHIENVLKGESKERVHRRLDTIETFMSDEATREAETNRETQTADRNEMQRETQRTINESFNFNTDASVHYEGGTIDATVNAGFSWDKSTDESTRNATNFAKEVMQKSAERIMQRAQSLRTTRRTSETEETNRHGLDNSKGAEHVIGIYRYVNKRYKAQVFNYGERMMFEFLIPEPSEFYKRTILNKSDYSLGEEFECKRPQVIEPSEIETFDQLTRANFSSIADRYKITGLSPFPCDLEVDTTSSEHKVIQSGRIYTSKQFNLIDNNSGMPGLTAVEKSALDNSSVLKDDKDSGSGSLTVNLKKGCACKCSIKIFSNTYRRIGGGWPGDTGVISISKGTQTFGPYDVGIMDEKNLDIITVPEFDIDSRTEPTLTLTVNSSWCRCFYIVVKLDQSPIPEIVQTWQKETHKAIWEKYNELANQRLLDCESDKKEFLKTKNNKNDNSLLKIKGKNVEINKMIINEELHKHAISLFAKEFDKESDGDLLTDNPIGYVAEPIQRLKGASLNGNACTINQPDVECKIFPVVDIKLAKQKGEVVQFLEQAFEWEKISYILYPYFYGDKSRWMETYDHYDNELNDTSFVAFLRAGYARVLVPVRDPYRDAVLQFLYTRKPWNGGSAPVIGDDLYLPIFEELRNQTDEYQDAVPEGEPWEFVLPTSLIYLQENSALPEFDGEFPTKKE